MPNSQRFRLIQMSRSRLTLAAGAVLAIAIGIGLLAMDVLRQMERVSESRSDNAQWALSQIELELMHLVSSADSAHHGDVPLSQLRLDYDIFYSRLVTLREGRVFAELRATPEFLDGIIRLANYMERHLPFVDGPDETLYDDLLALRDEGRDLVDEARNIALTGVQVAALESDARRADVTRTLLLTGALTVILFAFLVGLVVLLLRLDRINRLRAQENLATLSRLDAVVSTAMEALITLDGQGRIVDFNDAACRIFGLDHAQAVGREMAGLISDDGRNPTPFPAGAAPRGQGRYRVTARRGTGQAFPAEVSVSRVISGDDTLFVVFLRDLSIEAEAEAALVAARDRALAGEKAKAELLAVMSHEIRTPLNGMIGTIELLGHSPLSEEQRGYLQILQASGKLLMHHVNDVLDITRLDSGRASLVLAPVDLAALVQEVIQNQTPTARANGNVILFQPPADGRGRVMADGALLRQLLLNLVGNAVKFTRNGQITIGITHLPDIARTEICVSDTGIGIAPNDRDRIFEDFVTLDASYARDASGTGLGLGIVRRIVARMGGDLALDSQPGQGSTFRLRLPLQILGPGDWAEAPAPRPATAPAPVPARPLRVLVVEDNEFNRLILREMLRQEGHEVHEAPDGRAGIDMAAAQVFDVILMDISMPHVDGLQATQAIRQGKGASRGAPILAMTAHALEEETARFLQGGMTAVLVKPITREALRDGLGRALQRAPDAPAQAMDPPAPPARSPDKAQALFARFTAEAEACLARLSPALSDAAPTPPPADLRREVHRLAGSTAIFGADRLHELLARLETAWKTGQELDGPAIWAEIDQAWQAFRQAGPQAQTGLPQASSLR